jgi:hypothetical protein
VSCKPRVAFVQGGGKRLKFGTKKGILSKDLI